MKQAIGFIKKLFAVQACVILCLSIFHATNVIADDGAYSLKRLGFNEEQQEWQILVRCIALDQERYLVRKTESDPWCSRDLPGKCSQDRVVAAHSICYSRFNDDVLAFNEQQRLEEEQKLREANKARRDFLTQELANIKRERDQLDLDKVNLRNRLYELEQQEASINSLINASN